MAQQLVNMRAAMLAGMMVSGAYGGPPVRPFSPIVLGGVPNFAAPNVTFGLAPAHAAVFNANVNANALPTSVGNMAPVNEGAAQRTSPQEKGTALGFQSSVSLDPVVVSYQYVSLVLVIVPAGLRQESATVGEVGAALTAYFFAQEAVDLVEEKGGTLPPDMVKYTHNGQASLNKVAKLHARGCHAAVKKASTCKSCEWSLQCATFINSHGTGVSTVRRSVTSSGILAGRARPRLTGEGRAIIPWWDQRLARPDRGHRRGNEATNEPAIENH